MEIIVLTGGIATGKSTVSKYLKEKGFSIVDADLVARQVVEPGTPGLTALTQLFGPQILREDGELDRAALGQLLFSDGQVKERVNQVLHPLIYQEMNRQVLDYQEQGKSVVFLDIPLYFESGHNHHADEVWLVYLPEEIQLERLMSRNNYHEQEARQRIASQLSIEEKKALADVIIDNSGSLSELYAQVDTLIENLNT